MTSEAGKERDESGARTVGTGVFLLLAGLSVALMAINLPVGVAGLVASAAAGFVAARRRTAAVGLPGGTVDPEARLEGFVIDPLEGADASVAGWANGVGREPPAVADTDPLGAEVPPPPADEQRFVAADEPEPEPVDVVGAVDAVDAFDAFDAPQADGPFAGEPRPEPAFEPFESFESFEPALDTGFDPDPEEVARDERAGELRAAHAAAVEELNVAIARWHQLVGDDADPFDPEPVIRAHDPQLAFDPRQIEASPTVRTVASYHRRTQARWRVLWAGLGLDEVPHPDDVESVLGHLLADHHAAIADRERLEAAEARARARQVLRRPLVLAEPAAWISEGRLEQLLASLPDETEVVVVERAAG